MAATASAPPALSPGQATLDHDDSAISSPLTDGPLTEIGEGDGAESVDGMQLDPSLSNHDDALDSDSNLSEVHDEANDTEAETERLYDSPQAQRHKDVVVNQFNDGQVFERTPSKLKKTFSIDGADDGDDDSLSERDDASMTSSHPDEASPSKPKRSTELPSTEDTSESIDSKKRKRSPVAESSEPGQPSRKRTGSVVPQEQEQHKHDVDMHQDEAPSANSHSGDHSATDDNAPELPPGKRGLSRDGHSPVKDSQITKKITRNGSRRKGNAAEAHEHDSHDDPRDDGRGDEEVGVHDDDHAEHEGDDDAEATHDEELEKRRAAVEEWTDLEEKFVLFRERLYKDRLERLEQEESSLQAEPPSHPEYLNMKQCLDERLDKKLQHINREYELSVEGLERLAVARRAQIWDQFYQGVREQRSKMLEDLNKEWYETQNARRSAHSVPDYGLLFPTNPAQRTRNAVAYNSEVSFLAGLAKHEGFPAVPSMRGANMSEIDDDLEAMKRNSKPRQRSIMQPLEDYQAVAFGGSLGPAGEQFIKDTPWANPNHISHKINPGPTAQAVHANSPSQGKTAMAGPSHPPPALSNGHPVPQTSPHTSLFPSASPEMVRTANVLTQSAQMKRAGSRASKAAKETAPKQEPVSAMAS
ncbi:transcriptional regulatory protein dep1 [Colletotrichum karsti]|uniref:Transcriptional regulatory protein dep1 n=1 Tax=Colletotrichum karsti TaxID=1095194 RepID=A0A9P6I7H5_9PEZI|nr:transcriptional regulatory protein dep1 [Colletotrichum karsti]KAF9876521.1 transcriptional regulatory protein dep1 [Colletotrichum karsti]